MTAAGEIRQILVTHHHPDHTGSLVELARVSAAPGHTPGHTAFLLPRDGGVLLAGDAAINIAATYGSVSYRGVDFGWRSVQPA